MEVLGGVPVLGRIAATNMPTFEAETKVYPCISGSQAVLATFCAGRNLAYLIKMCTLCSQSMFPFWLPAAAKLKGNFRETPNPGKGLSSSALLFRTPIRMLSYQL